MASAGRLVARAARSARRGRTDGDARVRRAARPGLRPGPRPRARRAGWCRAATCSRASTSRLQPTRRVDAAIPPAWAQRGLRPHRRRRRRRARRSTCRSSSPTTSRGRQAMARYDARTLDLPRRRRSCTSTRTRSWRSTVRPASRTRWTASAATRCCATTSAPAGAGSRRCSWTGRSSGCRARRSRAARSGSSPTTISTACTGSTSTPARSSTSGPRRRSRARPRGSTPRRSRRGDLHATVVAADRTAVTLDHFRITGEPAAAAARHRVDQRRDQLAARARLLRDPARCSSRWRAVGTVFWRARTTIRPKR